MKLFGFNITREDLDNKNIPTILPPSDEDASIDISSYGGTYQYGLDLDGVVRSEAELIIRYRDLSLYPEIDSVVDDITNEAIISDDPNNDVIQVDLSHLDVPDDFKEAITEEFKFILFDLLNFNVRGYELFRRWYVDGRLPCLIVIDEKTPQAGIQDVRIMDPLKVRRVREIAKMPNQDGVELQSVVNDYYLFNDQGFNNAGQASVYTQTTAGANIKLTHDSVVSVSSGLKNGTNTMTVSYLHAAIRPHNQLRMLEDAAIISRLVRAPQRKVWNVEVGQLPKHKADAHMQMMMNSHKNKTIYDQSTGEVRDDRKFMAMTEDYWIPKRNGEGTSIDVLPGQDNFSNMDEVEYFQNLLYKALKIPLSRVNPDSMFTMGRVGEITRDEVKFQKYVARLRTQFAHLFKKLLEKQLILKGIVNVEEWTEISQDIYFKYAEDSYFEELKNADLLKDRATTTDRLMPYVDVLIPRRFIWKQVWQMNEDQIKENAKEIAEDIALYGPIGGEEDANEEVDPLNVANTALLTGTVNT